MICAAFRLSVDSPFASWSLYSQVSGFWTPLCIDFYERSERLGGSCRHTIPAAAQVGYSAILFYGYVGLVGLMLYACLRWWFKSKVSLAQVWCIYGRHTLLALTSLASIAMMFVVPFEKAWRCILFAQLFKS